MERTPPKSVGRPTMPESERAQNAIFRLKPDVDRDLEFVTLAGNYVSRTDALSTLITREAQRLRRNSREEVAKRVAARAATYVRSSAAGGARMDRAERILRAYIEELGGPTETNAGTRPHWSFSTEPATVEARTVAIDYLASCNVSGVVDELERVGLGELLRTGSATYTLLTIAADGQLIAQTKQLRSDAKRSTRAPRRH